MRVESHIELCGLCSLGNGLFGDGGGHCARRECEYEYSVPIDRGVEAEVGGKRFEVVSRLGWTCYSTYPQVFLPRLRHHSLFLHMQ